MVDHYLEKGNMYVPVSYTHLYGVLKPMDGVTPYRLEMQAKVEIGDAKNLYEYWLSLIHI